MTGSRPLSSFGVELNRMGDCPAEFNSKTTDTPTSELAGWHSSRQNADLSVCSPQSGYLGSVLTSPTVSNTPHTPLPSAITQFKLQMTAVI